MDNVDEVKMGVRCIAGLMTRWASLIEALLRGNTAGWFALSIAGSLSELYEVVRWARVRDCPSHSDDTDTDIAVT